MTTCRRKRHASKQEAMAYAARFIHEQASRIDIYLCKLCQHWHAERRKNA